jgi:thiol:disulfide interchange protein
MKKVLFLGLYALSLVAAAQPKQLVRWKFDYKKTGPSEYELRFHAFPEPGWHLYSQIESPDFIRKKDGTELNIHITDINDEKIGYRELNNYSAKKIFVKQSQIDTVIYAEFSKPTYFEFAKSKDYELVGKTTEPKPKEYKEPLFNDQIVRSYDGDVLFTQKVRALVDNPFRVEGTIDGITCDDDQCSGFSPPFDFSFDIKHDGPAATATFTPEQTVTTETGHMEAASPDTSALPQLRAAPVAVQNADDGTYLGLFIAGFIGGLFALLTPCVFPMIPMTVSFFIKQSKTKAAGIRNAVIYAVSIIAIYISLGLGVTLIFGADAMNNLATNVWFNLAFFLLLMVFAFSFLGAFEITLPSSFVNKMDAKSDKGGFLGIFFMAFTLGLVSFSCTGPIIGTLLVQAAATRALAAPFLGMLGFSVALALPFGLFAAFPGWLNSLPKSGGWLNSVKVVLGFLELALALKFLSNADLVVQAWIVTREVFIVIWVVIFGLLGAYLMGWFRLSHDNELKHVPVGRLLFAIVVFAFTIYLIPGIWGAPLKLISGFPPPDFYSESPEGFGGQRAAAGSSAVDSHGGLPMNAHPGPNGIPAFNDYNHGLEYARKVNKPVMLDFTGWACVNCRRMEDKVWSDNEVKRKLSEEFVLVSLYVDDKKDLPEELQEEVEWNGKKRKLKTVGNRWSYLQNTKYDSSTQPQYWIIDANEKRYSPPTSYDPDVSKYIAWLNEGRQRYLEQAQ